ncbi:MAG: leucine-rich repeat protein [Clostridia bacterium]|nr:leucine-rich repeat protein [Clostridia bacterium]MDY4083287.1 leucine-rich repeat protein [Eubacteriales bacterium]
MSKNARIITLATLLIVAIVASIVMVIVFATKHGDQSSSGNFEYTTSGLTCTITGYTGDDETVYIPERIAGKKVVAVKEGAFKGKSVVNIEFNGNFSDISLGDGVFSNMSSLVYVKLPQGLTKIPNKAFYDCKKLTHVTIPSTVQSIGDYAFYNCSALVYSGAGEDDGMILPTDLLKVGKYAFYGCNAITKLTLNDKLESIEEYAFNKASNLKRLIVGEASLLTTIGDHAFDSAKIESTTSNKIIFPKLENIGKYAFANNSSYFNYFYLGKSVKMVDDYAFSGCGNLTTVHYDKDIALTSMGKGVFFNDSALATIQAEDSALTDPNALPDSMTAIPELAFSGCYNLLNKKDFVIGKNVSEIGSGAFAIYNSAYSSRATLTIYELKVDAQNENFKMQPLGDFKRPNTTDPSRTRHSLLMDKSGQTLIAYIGTYTTFERTSESEYNGCYRTDPSDLNSKARNAFTFLDSEEIRNTLTTIGDYAFAGVRFDRIYIVPGVKNIGNFAFKASDINVVLFGANDCTFEQDTFDGMQSDLTVYLMKGTSGGLVQEQVGEMIEDDVTIEFGWMDEMFK